MEHLTVKNFHQISDFDEDIKDFIVFIGPQASGKSTLSKIIYFHKLIPDELYLFLASLNREIDALQFDTILLKFMGSLKKRFINLFENHQFDNDFQISYRFNENTILTISGDCNDIYIGFCDDFNRRMDGTISQLNSIKQAEAHKQLAVRPDGQSNIVPLEQENDTFGLIMGFISSSFNNFKFTSFIPAGRSMISHIPDLTAITSYDAIYSKKILDLTLVMNQFFLHVAGLRSSLKKGVPKQPNYIKTPCDLDVYSIIQERIKTVLHGNIEFNDIGECLLYAPDKSIPMLSASSGQQESLWILLSLFALLEYPISTFVVIEEPEAHLFPEAQKDITELITLVSNCCRNQVVITTHSPYILTSLNNLIYAYQVGQKKRSRVNDLVQECYWLNPEKVSVYYLDPDDDKYARSMIDLELNQINADEIDSISSKLNSIYDKLESIEYSE